VGGFLDHLSGQDDWRALAATLRRILSGERDPDILLSGLDATDTIIVSDVLRGLAESVPAGEEHEEEGVSIEAFLQMVAQACGPDAPPGLGPQLRGATQNMAAQEGVPEEYRALGRVLNRVLSGERDPDLAGLSPQLADAVRGMLAGL
jgi:hypothetical protein